MARRQAIVGVVLVAMLSLVASPALAQDPYPPPPPGGQGSTDADVSAEVRCSDDGTRTLVAHGEGFLADSTVEIEIRAHGSAASDGPLAEYDEPVDGEGTFDTQYELPDDYDQRKVRLRVRGRDAEDRPVTESHVLDAKPNCGSGTGVQGQDQDRDAGDPDGANVLGQDQEQNLGAPAVDRDADGSLAVTGRNIWLLVALALLLATLGTVLARFRRDRATGAA